MRGRSASSYWCRANSRRCRGWTGCEGAGSRPRRLSLRRSQRLASFDRPRAPVLARRRLGDKRLPGLPHFSHGIWRNWGRDTFIALPGCLLIPGRFDDARYIILAFAGTLRHGLIPNLLGEGVCSRYNCRDAVWFWLLAIKEYVQAAPNGLAILDDKVRRIYPNDDTVLGAEEREEPLHETMYEAIQRHFAGISFRERDAGSKIDEHMTNEGFNLNAYIDLGTGFVMGGNQWNCGTWMDKMGSSDRAGNRGQPATPRDGAAVELQGLCYAVVNWLAELSSKESQHFPHTSVVHEFPYEDHPTDEKQKLTIEWTWREWADRLKENFGRFFYVPENQDEIDEAYHPRPEMINRRGIVKDSFNSSQLYTDYQLRPNFPIALAVAPDLLDPEQAWHALTVAEQTLQGHLGMKTLDPSDFAYNGYYDNSNDGTDKKTAKGWNYHQGPEWLWVSGFFLRAQLAVAWRLREKHGEVWEETLTKVKHKLGAFWVHLQKSPWRSLPELTNSGGAECGGSCPAQAWSVGCILETVADLDHYGKMS
uniref:Glycogen debranching enzyme C-terminal domain-containing protein n=1 Tax=Plectus sambesii TaxID=2011161 RepID=A0A914X3C5_9BILA